MKNFLAFDLGASSGRGIVGSIDDGKLTLTELNRFENGAIQVGDRAYWDVISIFSNIKRGMTEYAARYNEPLSGIAIDTWGVDFGLLDANDELLGNPIFYRDNQTDGMVEKVFEGYGREKLYTDTGTAILKFNTLFQLMGMKKRDSVALREAKTLLFMPDLLSWMLTGEKYMEKTIASTAQIMDARSREICQPLLSSFDLPTDIFPRIVDAGTLVGYVKEDIGEETGVGRVPVFAVAGHDTASAVAAVPADSDNYAFISSGTWSLIGTENAFPLTDDKALEGNFTNEWGAFDSYRFLRNVMGLWIVQECRAHWKRHGKDMSFAEITELAERAEPFLAFIDPDDGIFFEPGNMPGKVRNFCRETGQRVPETEGEIIRVVLESLALRYRWCMQYIEELSGKKMDKLNIVGGGTQNELLCSLTASAIGKPVVAGPVEATAIGNILMQAVGAGLLADIKEVRDVVKASFLPKVFLPTDGKAWDAAYERMLQIIQ